MFNKLKLYNHSVQMKLRSAQHSNILLEPELKEIRNFVEENKNVYSIKFVKPDLKNYNKTSINKR